MIFRDATVLVAPSPATSGVSIGIHGGEIATAFSNLPVYAMVYPSGTVPNSSSEMVLVTAATLSTSTLTVSRAENGTPVRTIVVGDWITALTPANFLGILGIANGGTGASTANGALNNLLPSQTGNANEFLMTNGTNTSWQSIFSVYVSELRPLALTSSKNNWSPGTLTGETYIYLSASTPVTITGLLNDSANKSVFLINNGTSQVNITHLDGASLAANQFILPFGGPLIMMEHSVYRFFYDSTAQKWRNAP